jgi:hypothetical protein
VNREIFGSRTSLVVKIEILRYYEFIMRIIFVFLCLCVFVFLIMGCSRNVVESDLDWPVKEVTVIKDNREVEVVSLLAESGNVEIAEPQKAIAEVSDKQEEGQVEIIEPQKAILKPNSEDLELDSGDIATFVDNPVPFVPQAPFAVWDDLHNEACEEAAMIIVNSWFKDEDLNAHLMEQAILNLVKWEQENGYTIDVTADETVKILNDYFKLKAEAVAEVTIKRIKQEILAGQLIIIPAAGRLLGNPYYRRPGPLYHMLVIRGYDESRGEFITNDPGTKRGEGFRYKYQTLINAIHDWPKQGKTKDDVSEAEMNAAKKVMIVVGK